MSGLSYEVEQVRRVLDRHDPRNPSSAWICVRERMAHVAARSGQEERFDLHFLGLERSELDPDEFAQRAKQYQDQSFDLIHNHGFRIHDAARAASNYSIVFLGLGARVQRTTYQVAVISKVGQRGVAVDLDLTAVTPIKAGTRRWGSGERSRGDAARLHAPSIPEAVSPPAPGSGKDGR